MSLASPLPSTTPLSSADAAAAIPPTSPPALTPFPFRTLPPHVRNLIYTLLFDTHASHSTHAAAVAGAGAANPQILSTCHQVNHEATRLLYSASATQVVVTCDGIEVRNGLLGDYAGVEESEGKRRRGKEDLKSLRRFEVVGVRIVDDGRAGEHRGKLVQAVGELCAVLAEGRYLKSLSVEVEISGWGSEEERSLLEPFALLSGLGEVRFAGGVGDWGFVGGLRGGMLEGVDGGEGEGSEEMDLAAWEDVEGSAM